MEQSWSEVDTSEVEVLSQHLQLKDGFHKKVARKPCPTISYFRQAQGLVKILCCLYKRLFETGTTKRGTSVYLLVDNNNCFGLLPKQNFSDFL